MARPKSEEARQAALSATVDLLASHGVEGVTFEDVASRSGVAKSTLYRHFGTKQAMVVAAATGCFVEMATPDTGDLATDLRTIFERAKGEDEAHRVPDLLPTLIAAADRDEDLHRLLTAVLEERRRPIRTVLQLAQLRGEIGREVDLDLALSLLLGPFTQRRMVDRQEITPEFADEVITHVVAALRATGDRVPA